MITFKTPLSLKQYFSANFVKLLHSRFKVLFIAPIVYYLALLIFVPILDYDFNFTPLFYSSFYVSLIKPTLIFALIVFFLIIIIKPIIIYVRAKFSFKVREIEYFFDNDTFGWNIGNHSHSTKKDEIKKISIKEKLIHIALKKGEFFFFSDKQTIKEAGKKLLKSNYKELIKDNGKS